MQDNHFDVIVLGGGPAGQKAAVQAAKAGRKVCLVERQRALGGACVHRGTIPSKTLRETAQRFQAFRRQAGGAIPLDVPADMKLASLMNRMEDVVGAHADFMGNQLERNDIDVRHGRARFAGPNEIEIESARGACVVVRGEAIIVATGSRPRTPDGVPVDHEHILDSDSILSMNYLPQSLTVLGGGIVGCEYASIFASLGVPVTILDRSPRPLAFLDPELSSAFVRWFESHEGCVHVGGATVASMAWDGIEDVVTTLDNGWTVRSAKLLCAAGRVANVDQLQVEKAGLSLTDRGYLAVDEHCRTAVPNIYAVGDVIGPPALASTGMEQGRRAARAALGMDIGSAADTIPVGIYTIPEISSVGLDEGQAREKHGGCIVGRAPFGEVARAQISAHPEGFLKLVVDAAGDRLLGAQCIGEGATEIIHLAQMALVHGDSIDFFVENIFNFPTMAEAYRIAALDVVRQRPPVGVAAGVTPA